MNIWYEKSWNYQLWEITKAEGSYPPMRRKPPSLGFSSPNAKQVSPPEELRNNFFKQEFFRLTFYRSWRLNKHTRTLKTSRHTSDKGKGMGAHHLINWWFPMIWNQWVWKMKVFRNLAILQSLNYFLTILLINFLWTNKSLYCRLLYLLSKLNFDSR